jgi:hypothetical protein
MGETRIELCGALRSPYGKAVARSGKVLAIPGVHSDAR